MKDLLYYENLCNDPPCEKENGKDGTVHCSECYGHGGFIEDTEGIWWPTPPGMTHERLCDQCAGKVTITNDGITSVIDHSGFDIHIDLSNGIDRRPVSLNILQLERSRSVELSNSQIKEFTCDNCPTAFMCVLAFDHYNTNGDCLASK